MENELKFKYVDPEEPLYEGIQNVKWVSKDQILNNFPDQPERSKREDVKVSRFNIKVPCEPIAEGLDSSEYKSPYNDDAVL